MSTQDIRWIQRFNNFVKALSQLKEAVELAQQRQLSKLEEQGLIQAFEFTHEIVFAIRSTYCAEFEAIRIKLDELKQEEQA